MIKCYFGVPGCGKTTILAKIATSKWAKKNYDDIYTINFECIGCIPIKYEVIKDYKIKKILVLIDEITMNADNRSFKTFTNEERDFFILHRHLQCDIIYATQNYENVDKKIRDLTAELWFMNKSVVPLIRQFTTAKRIYRNITINEYTGDLKLGYRFCTFIEMLFAKNMEITFRPLHYKKYDSWDELSLKDRPLYIANEEDRIKPKPSKLESIIKNGRRKRNKSRDHIKNNIIKYLNNSNRH